jgi:hypothetical protein
LGPDRWGRSSFTDLLSKIVPDAAIRARIHMPGLVPLSAMGEHVRSARVAVVASIGFESFSYSTLEAMAAARPTIVTRTGALSELIEHERSGIVVTPDEPHEMAAALERFLADRSFSESCRLNAFAKARRQYDTSVVLPENWWAAFSDPVLDALQREAVQASPDLKTAALHFAQARVQRQTVSPQHGLQGNLTASATGRRESELGAGVRLIDAIGADPAKIAPLIAEPYGFYQVGFDVSWELDLWGRISSTIEQANADIARQGALLDLARVSLAADIARSFFDVRTTQRQIRGTREEIAAMQELRGARIRRALTDDAHVHERWLRQLGLRDGKRRGHRDGECGQDKKARKA